VVLPDQSGWALAAQLAARHPGTKLLFMSGHAADTIGQRGALEQDVDFLAKPFSRDDLARKVRETLDR
jgi:two-component system sensor histidine kinase EvgS